MLSTKQAGAVCEWSTGGEREVFHPETDETRERRKGVGAREKTKTFPGAQLEPTDGKRRQTGERKGEGKGGREISKECTCRCMSGVSH